MHFEQPMHRGPRGPPMRGGLLGEYPRGGFRGRGPRMPPDCPPNFRGPRGPFPRGMGMHGPGGPRGPPGPNFGGRFPQHMGGNRFGPPRPPPHGMHGNGPRPMMGPAFGMPPPDFCNDGRGPPNFHRDSPQNFPDSGEYGMQNAPGVDLSGEIWVETKTGEGKSYFYNARTRETSWTRPENVKILNQEQIEAMASAVGGADESDKENGSQKTNSVENPNAPNPFPFMQMGQMPAPAMGMMPPPAFGMLPPPFGIPPPGMMPSVPFGMPPPPFPVANMGIPSQAPTVIPTENVNDATTTEEKVEAVESKPAFEQSQDCDWAEYKAPDGRSYYYNKVTQQSTWERPEALNDQEIKTLPTSEKNDTAGEKSESAPSGEAQESESSSEGIDKTQNEICENGTDLDGEVLADNSSLPKVEETEAMDQQETPQQPVDKSRPVSSTPIPGTPWCVVRTGDDRVFFFNPSTRCSVWDKPDDLKDYPAVDELLQSSQPPPAENKKVSIDSEADSSPDPKKIKLEETSDAGIPEEAVPPSDPKNSITPGKESAIEAELRAAKERANIPLDVRTKEFRDMLAEKGVSAFSNWEKELHKIVFDPRYLLLTSKERKQVFEKYVRERAEEERNERRKKIQQRKDDYIKLLEEASLTATSTFSDFVDRHNKDDRFKKIEKMRERQNIFNGFLHDLRRKEKDERSSQREKTRKDFMELLKEQKGLDKQSRWKDIKKDLGDDPRYKAVDSSTQREEWFKEFVRKLSHNSEDDTSREREKQKRAEASIREREKEVQRTLSTSLREADKERELHKHDEALAHFKALLADLVRTPDVSWHDAKKTLRKDHRWKAVESLDRDEREKVFEDHISSLNLKKKEKFRELLDETSSIALTSTWKEVKDLVKEDARYTKFSSSDRKCEKEFKEYIKDKMIAAKADFRELLAETKIITYKSRKLLEDTDHLRDIEKILENDKRYLVLQCIKEERWELLMSYIDNLDKKGPPPPPTASEPTRRPFPK